MATYIPNASDAAEPLESRSVESAALEFRTLKSQELRGMRFPAGDSAGNRAELPLAAARAGRFLAFDAVTGQPIPGPLLAAWTITQAQIASIDTVATNIAAVLTVQANMANIVLTAANIAAINTAATNIASIVAVDANEANINIVAANIAAILAAVADLPNLAVKVSKTADTGSAVMPAGTTAQRDAAPTAGYIRFNATLNQFEGYNGTSWNPVGAGASGAPNNPVFYENDKLVTGNYTIVGTKNAMTAGPIAVDTGVTVTIETGAVWTIV